MTSTFEAPPASWKPPVYEKSAAEESELYKFVSENPLMGHLDRAGIEAIIGAFQLASFPDGERIIRQGDTNGDTFYLLRDGRCDIDVDGAAVKRVEIGGCFGELALLYDAPRAATVTVVGGGPDGPGGRGCECWVLDRMTFRSILMDRGRKDHETCLRFVDRVPLLAGLSRQE